MSREDHDRLSTADLAAGTTTRPDDRPSMQQQEPPQPPQSAVVPEMQERPLQEMQERRLQPRDPQVRDTQRDMQDDPRAMQSAPFAPSAMAGSGQQVEQLAALFPPDAAADFRNRWDQVQIGFVDDPRQAVQHADELVAEVMKSLASSFAEQRSRLEAGLGRGEQANTENLRMALRSYRSFFERLLSL